MAAKYAEVFGVGSITKTCLYNFDLLKPHFYIVKLRFTGAYIIFSSPELCSGWAIVITFRPSSVRASVRQHFQTTSPLKPLSQFCSNFIWSLLRVGERKIAKMVAVRWLRWPPCPYMVKTFKNLLLHNGGCLGAESLHESSGTGGQPKLLKELSYVDVWPFYGKVKFASLCIYMSSIHLNGKIVKSFKRLLLRSLWANFVQISYGATLVWGNKRLLKLSRSVDQDGRHAHIW